jgi:hypothetical protein
MLFNPSSLSSFWGSLQHLTFDGSPKSRIKIVGDLFYPRAKRIVRGGKGRVFGTGKIYEHFVWPQHTSQQIYKDLLCSLEGLSKKRPLDKRYLYLEDFCRFGPVINWRQIFGFE